MGAYLEIVKERTKVLTSDGRTIPCNYLHHPVYSRDCLLCAGLHYVFVRFAEDRTYAKGYEVRTAINLFLDFKVEYDRQNPSALQLSSLLQISPEVFRAYDFFVKRNRGPKGIATRLKGALKSVSKDHDDGMPSLVLPLLDEVEERPAEPLTEACFNQISDAFRKHVDQLYEKIKFRDLVAAATPYVMTDHISSFACLHRWVPEATRTLNTLLLNGHPFKVGHEEFSGACRRTHDARFAPDPANVVEAIYARYNHPKIRYKRRQTQILISLDDLFQLYFPTAMDQAVIFAFIQLQTGWNKETVMAIDGDNFEHVMTGALNVNLKLICSEKQRSQSVGKPFFDPKQYFAASDSKDKYSAYNLINLARELSKPLAHLEVECGSERAKEGHNPLFLCIRNYAQMCATTTVGGALPGRFLSVANKSMWEGGIKKFFEIFEVHENGQRFRTVGQLSSRLRPTWIRFHRDNKARPLSLIAAQQGHNSTLTTDVHYDSSGGAMQVRRDRLRSELGEVVQVLRKRNFKGILGKTSAPSGETAPLRFFTIPGHEKSLWACSDSFKPDWPGFASSVPVGTKCSMLHQCLFCSRVYIFEDSLPFLMHRQAVIQKKLDSYRESDFDTPLADESAIIDYVLDEWGDDQALREAARYIRKYDKLMFEDVRSLSILFED